MVPLRLICNCGQKIVALWRSEEPRTDQSQAGTWNPQMQSSTCGRHCQAKRLMIRIYAKYSPLPSAFPVGLHHRWEDALQHINCYCSPASLTQQVPKIRWARLRRWIMARRMLAYLDKDIKWADDENFQRRHKVANGTDSTQRIRSEERVMDWMRLEGLSAGRC